MYGIFTMIYLHLVEFYCTCSAIYTVYPSNFFKHKRKHSQVHVCKMRRLFCSFDRMRPPKWSQFQRQIIASKLSLVKEYCISSSQAWIMLWISGRVPLRLGCWVAIVQSLVFHIPCEDLCLKLTFTPPEARPLGGDFSRLYPPPSLRARFPLKNDEKKTIRKERIVFRVPPFFGGANCELLNFRGVGDPTSW